MKFFCEYCGNRIDAEKDNKCPNCGASYKKNKTFIKLEEERKKQNDISNENRQKAFNHVLKFSKWIIIIPVSIFLIIIITFIILSSSIIKKSNEDVDKFQSNAESMIDSIFNSDLIQDQIPDNKKEKDVTVMLGEYGSTSKYKAKVTDYKVVEDKFNRLQEGYEYVEFNLQVENISGKELRSEDVNCIVDGVAQTNEMSSGYSELPFFIQKGLTVKGSATFEVPKNATSYDIKYGDYITIHIEK